MKKLFCLSIVALSFGIQGVANAQLQGYPISEEDYYAVVSSVCEASFDARPEDIISSVSSKVDSSTSPEELTELQEIAMEMFSMPSMEKSRLCSGGDLAS